MELHPSFRKCLVYCFSGLRNAGNSISEFHFKHFPGGGGGGGLSASTDSTLPRKVGFVTLCEGTQDRKHASYTIE